VSGTRHAQDTHNGLALLRVTTRASEQT
jgi:hypothetical protein